MPIGHAVNPNIAMVSGFSVHQDAAEARRRGAEGFQFFGFALGWHYVFGEHRPGRTDIWERFEKARPSLPEIGARQRHRHAGGDARASRALSRMRASIRSPSSSRAAATGTSISARRWTCSPAR